MEQTVFAPEITGDDTPCSLSGTMITDVLRGTLGYNGIVMTDMLGDSAITARYSDGDAAVAAIVAGADILLCPADFSKAYQGVLDAVSAGTITEERIQESLYRNYRVKYKNTLNNVQ